MLGTIDGPKDHDDEFSDAVITADCAEVAENLPRSRETPVMSARSVLLFSEMAGNVTGVGYGRVCNSVRKQHLFTPAGASISFLEVSCVRSVPALEFSCSTPFG